MSMNKNKDRKKSIVSEYKINAKDTGSSSVQVALLTDRIKTLSAHLKEAPKDYSTMQGLYKMVGRRKSLLSYIKRTDEDSYKKIIQQLDLRK